MCSESKTWLGRPALFTRSMPQYNIKITVLRLSQFQLSLSHLDLFRSPLVPVKVSHSLTLFELVDHYIRWHPFNNHFPLMTINAFSYSALDQVDLMDKSTLKSIFSSHPEVIIAKLFIYCTINILSHLVLWNSLWKYL